MRKRLSVLILAALLLVLSACGSADTKKTGEEGTISTEESQDEETASVESKAEEKTDAEADATEQTKVNQESKAEDTSEDADTDYVQLMFDWADETKDFRVDLNEDGKEESIELAIDDAYQYSVSVNDRKYVLEKYATYFSKAFLVKKDGNYYIYMQLKWNAFPLVRDIEVFQIKKGLVYYVGSFNGQLMEFETPDSFIVRRFTEEGLLEAECNVGYDGMPVMINERYEQIPDKEDITPEDLFGESMEEAYQEKYSQLLPYVSDDEYVCELTGEILQCNVNRQKITNQWINLGEVEFAVESAAEQFHHGNLQMSAETLEQNIKQALGKEVGEDFVLHHYWRDLYDDTYRYTILEIKKNKALGNGKETVEYGDTIRAICYKAEDIEYHSEFVGSFLLQVDNGVAEFLESDYSFSDQLIEKMEKKALKLPMRSGDSNIAPGTGFDVYDEEYVYVVSVTAVVYGETKPESTIPEGWSYQFAAPKIGSFKDYTEDSPACPVDMEGGVYFGFEDQLADGCSTWCACNDYYCKVTASSSLAPQGTQTYGAENLKSANRMNAWAEGVPGDGIGETIEIREMYFGGGDPIFRYNEVCIVNGYAKDETTWLENNRVKSMKLYFMDEYMGTITLEDTMLPQYVDLSPVAMKVGNGCEAKFRFEIADVYKGTKYDDTCISGIVVEFEGRSH
ncbi:MAG: hypothetical protein IKJ39_03235 [Lachnospiraceae bacterium]|nr:hypothetical protein [Lachnospiraceae bacterium]